MTLPEDYTTRVYAGGLGTIIGVYLGCPIEQWNNERIERELGEVNYYVHERLNKPLIVTDAASVSHDREVIYGAKVVAAGRGLRRYVALVLDSDRRLRLIARHDDARTTLAEFDAAWYREAPKYLRLSIGGGNIAAAVDDEVRHIVADDLPRRGAIGLLVEARYAEFSEVQLCPNTPTQPSLGIAELQEVGYRC